METRTRWMRQAQEAGETLRAKGMSPDMFLADAFTVDRDAATRLMEALDALGAPISDELRDLAGLTHT